MNKYRIANVFMSFLLLFALLFSVLFAIPPHQEACEHTTCETCVEIQAVEQSLAENMQAHESCVEDACQTCVELEQVFVLMQEKAAGHSCHTEACHLCVSAVVSRRLRVLFCVLTMFAFGYALYRMANYASCEKEGIYRTFSLLSWKVRLNN